MCMFPVLLALHVWSRDACQFPVSFENQTALHLLPRFPPYFIYVYLYSENFSRSASVLNLVIALCFIFGRDLDWNEKKKKKEILEAVKALPPSRSMGLNWWQAADGIIPIAQPQTPTAHHPMSKLLNMMAVHENLKVHESPSIILTAHII